MVSSGRQLDQVLAGLKEEHADTKIGVSQSPREMLEHLTDCYMNTVKAAEGKEPEWGSFSAAGKSWADLQKACAESRATAVEIILGTPEDKVGELALNYIIMHDTYHVGQLALVRLQTDPTWDAYSIYE